jgi:hypothetical protein
MEDGLKSIIRGALQALTIGVGVYIGFALVAKFSPSANS